MNFKSVVDWVQFLHDSSIEQILDFVGEDLDLEAYLSNNGRIEINKTTLMAVKDKIRGTVVEELIWNETLPYIQVDFLPDVLIEYLIENRVALETLAHLSLPDKYLWMLASEAEEALITLGKRHYLRDDYTCSQFDSFLKKALNSYWLWSSLLSIAPNNKDKRKALVKNLFQLTDFEELKEEVIEEITEDILARTTRIEVIRKHYSPKSPRLLRGIAQNPCTPMDILEELTNSANIKFAKQIRQLALDNLKARESRDGSLT